MASDGPRLYTEAEMEELADRAYAAGKRAERRLRDLVEEVVAEATEAIGQGERCPTCGAC